MCQAPIHNIKADRRAAVIYTESNANFKYKQEFCTRGKSVSLDIVNDVAQRLQQVNDLANVLEKLSV